VGREKSGFEKLEAYQLSEHLADACWQIVRDWKTFDRDTVAKQLVRAADSIGANIAEGYGRGSVGDNKRFVRIAVGSLYETKHWLRRAFVRKLIDDQQVEQLRPMVERLLPLLNGYLRSIGRTHESSTTHDQRPTTHDES